MTATLARYDDGDGFSVLLPQQPYVSRTQRPYDRPEENSDITSATATTADGVTYPVTRIAYSPDGILVPEKVLAGTKKSITNEVKGELAESAKAPLPQNQGELFTVANPQKIIRARTALVGKQLFTLFVAYSGNPPESATTCLNS